MLGNPLRDRMTLGWWRPKMSWNSRGPKTLRGRRLTCRWRPLRAWWSYRRLSYRWWSNRRLSYRTWLANWRPPLGR